MKSLVWFRNDLRMDDNPALRNACINSDEVHCIYIFSKEQLSINNEANCKIDFIIRNLKSLSDSLKKSNIPLTVIHSDGFSDNANKILNVINERLISKVYWNNMFGVDENKRDQEVQNILNKNNIDYENFDDQVVYSPGTIKTKEDKPYSVFTPFKRRWIENFDMNFLELEIPRKLKKFSLIQSDLSVLKFTKTHSANIDLWPAGESAAQEKLANFLQSKAQLYSESRNSPIIDGTSRISPYLALGILSPKRCILEALKLNNFEFTSGNKGICKWIDEIVWREFYRNIMHSFPRVSQNHPFQDYTNAIQWRHSSIELKAFYAGKTGFPIVDAGIRQMLAEGWMHNRLRMVVAMFFTKNMLHDWRLGEKFFMQHLIDGDFSSNNGGWQWSSSTGTDSAPYFRIFNPITQSQNFDPNGEFIKKFIPELKDVPIGQIHQPKDDLFSSADYPAPILDLKESRLRAIQAFKDAREVNSI